MKKPMEPLESRTSPSEPELDALRESIRACAAGSGSDTDERFDRETEALLRMLEKPRQRDEADQIIDGLLHGERIKEPGATGGKVTSAAAVSEKKLRHPVVTIMLLTFFVLLIAATVIIWYSYPSAYGGYDGYGESVPSTPASLCEVDDEIDSGYMLGIDGSFLAVYYNGKVQRALSFPVAQLSDYDRELLQNGIPLEDEAALRRAIEDYTS